MSADDMAEAVRVRDAEGRKTDRWPLLEASGRITLANVRQVAQTGVDRIAVGAITHSAPILDIGLDLLDEPDGGMS
jgi:nicotinate-nucleotide pyrophosphorylase (carboxylating)